VHGAYLLGLQIYAGSFENGWWGEMACSFSQGTHWYWVQAGGVQIGFQWAKGPVCHRVQFYLMLYLLLFGKKKKREEKKRNKWPGAFSQGRHTLLAAHR
jgi:hypothetical protein